MKTSCAYTHRTIVQYLQQHLNRGLKRYARLTGNVQPSKRALEHKLQKRMEATDPLIGRANRKRSQAERRHKNKSQEENAGYDKDAASSSSAAASSADDGNSTTTDTGVATGNSTDTSSTSDDTGKTSKKKSKGKDKNGGSASSTASDSTATGVASSNSTDTGAASSSSNSTDTGAASSNATSTGTAASASGSSSTAEGFPEIDLEAQTNGGLTAANAPTASNSLGLDIEANDVGYIATVQVGTPPQDFNFLMDTGSADMWVGSEDCTTQGTTQGCVRTSLTCAVCVLIAEWWCAGEPYVLGQQQLLELRPDRQAVPGYVWHGPGRGRDGV